MGSLSLLYFRLLNGDQTATHELWARFFPRLVGLAKTILGNHKIAEDAEDAVQVAFFQFLQCVADGRYDDILRRDDMWRILARFTIMRARRILRREQAQKRGGGKVYRESELADSDAGTNHLDALVSSLPTADCDMIFEELLNVLDNDLQEIAMLRLAGYTNMQIKDFQGCSLRSIERRVQLIRSLWNDYVQDK